jgi:hypothetical protein
MFIGLVGGSGLPVSTVRKMPLDGDAEEVVAQELKRRPSALHTNPFDVPDACWQITYDSGLVSRPIAASYVPAVAAEDALLRATVIGFNAAFQPGVPTVVLRSVSVGYDGQDSTFAPHAGWMIIWYGGKPRRYGGPVGRAASPVPMHEAAAECIYVVVVDASTGEPQDARQICR